MKYTDDQDKALKGMLEWSKTPVKVQEDLLCTLNGAAGTGKTTIARDFIVGLNLPSTKIAVTAPTHKAKKVIQDATDFKAQTIQKLLGLRPDVNMDGFNPNKPVFNPLADDSIQFYKYVLIDEASMLNKDAFKLICEKAFKYNVRIVFLGDEYQLPPINEEISKVFSDVTNLFTLVTVVRQDKNNPMFNILKMLRADIRFGTDNGIKELVKLQSHTTEDDEQGFKCLTQKGDSVFGGITFGSELLKYYFSTEYQYNKDHIKFLSYTNTSIEQWSTALRNRLLKEDAKNLLNVGEVLTSYNTITTKSTNTLILENSEDYIVVEVEEDKSKELIKGFRVKLENSRGAYTTVFIIDHTKKDNLKLFKNLLLDKLAKAKQYRGRYWAIYYTFKNTHLSLETLPINESEPATKYGNLLCSKDLYYGYGCTVHKSQGSTYNNVAVNLSNLYNNPNTSERARLIYVALSRTKNMNLILVK